MNLSNTSERALSQLFGLQPESGGARRLLPALLLALCWAVCLGAGGKLLRFGPLFLVLMAPIALGWLLRSELAFGLFQVSPLLWAALAWPARVRTDGEPDVRTLFYRWIFVAWIFYLAVVAVNPQDPGLNWGSRYMLSALPWGVLLAAYALESVYSRTEGIFRIGAPAAAVALVAVGAVANVRGVQAISTESEAFTSLTLDLRTPAEATVFGQWDWAGHPAADPEARLFLVRNPVTEGETFFSILDRLDIESFTFDGRPWGFEQMRLAGLRHVPQYVILGRESPKSNAVRFQRLAPSLFPGG
jgi:hypothetical protein